MKHRGGERRPSVCTAGRANKTRNNTQNEKDWEERGSGPPMRLHSSGTGDVEQEQFVFSQTTEPTGSEAQQRRALTSRRTASLRLPH
ncbi:hypothetical protein EYF80_049293 [Liparis tanakae]|uniref:Uncharacterized protein n=1 Tax=Liparis tanakae TaxID=230148 RepID=A0A4Z2FIF1_9TELE|nr:hypothetical protein EYF80_049293 [Liparis tanakae]